MFISGIAGGLRPYQYSAPGAICADADRQILAVYRLPQRAALGRFQLVTTGRKRPVAVSGRASGKSVASELLRLCQLNVNSAVKDEFMSNKSEYLDKAREEVNKVFDNHCKQWDFLQQLTGHPKAQPMWVYSFRMPAQARQTSRGILGVFCFLTC